MKKKLATIAFAFAFISSISRLGAQQPPPPAAGNPAPAPTPKLEADDKPNRTSSTDKADAGSNPSDSAEDLSKAEAWRREVLAWSHPRRIGEGTKSGSINEMSRPLLVLGTVNGDISTLSRDVAVLGDVTGDISAISGTVTVLGTVGGDISVVGGDLRVAGKVNGDASVVGGALETAAGGRVLGETSTVGKGNFKFNFNRSWSGGRQLHSQSFFHSFWLSPFMFMWRSALLILWVALGCAIAALFTPAVLRARAELQNAP
ncbi:MAG TPA: polymer-forming cytoskeletal protein, partial [Chthoniobacteraceae bacterium]|nr:polymer-forming cytoskeletal protein [Chthoniobacteraceae bacterium]